MVFNFRFLLEVFVSQVSQHKYKIFKTEYFIGYFLSSFISENYCFFSRTMQKPVFEYLPDSQILEFKKTDPRLNNFTSTTRRPLLFDLKLVLCGSATHENL